jgi:hypothetical protein
MNIKKSNKLKLAYMYIASALLWGMTACGPKTSTPSSTPSQTDSASVETTDTLALEETAPAVRGLTFEKASAMVNPEQHYDEQAIDSIFTAIGLPKVQAERYVWDADYGGNSPAISYVWGYGVELKDWNFKATAEDYHGVHFNFFFDKSKKTGQLKTLTVITSDSQWYEKFMADAKAAGMKLNGYLDKAVYQREGKEYMLKKGEQTFYFINDFSADGKYEVEFGFDNGIDV